VTDRTREMTHAHPGKLPVTELTARQKAVYDFLLSHLQEYGFPPTVREICKQFGIKSTKGVTDHLAALERKGFIRRRKETSRGIEIVDKKPSVEKAVELPVLGSIAAGEPSLAVQNPDGYIAVDQRFVPKGESFVLRVRGDSMIEAHILDGDYVIVKRQQEARDGDIVAVCISDEATVKRILRGPDRIVLKAENRAVEDIEVEGSDLQSFRILGVVTAVVRHCGN